MGLSGLDDDPTTSLSPSAGTVLGDYELIQEIARGGMGVVYRGRQMSLHRLVAVKVLLGGRFGDETISKRFRREAEAAASLNHPNIVAIYEVGTAEGQPYFSMELIEGRSLAELARDKPLAARQAALLVKTLADAVQFAHERGVLHRDLKPSNVLMDQEGRPHITDFGLAKRLAGDADLTLAGQVLGTPNYMPPEQAEPGRGPATAASDVYSLGAILYHLLTGRALFLSETVHGTIRQLLEQEPVSPRLLNSAVSRDLETICLKCLSKEPHGRFATARELSEELQRWLDGKPILSRPISAAEKAWRWCRRHRAVATAGAAVLTLLLVVGIGSPIAVLRINRARLQAEANEQRAKRAEQEAETRGEETRRNLYAAEMNMANQVLDLPNGIRRISDVVSRWEYDRPDLRGWEWYYLNALAHRESLTLHGHQARIHSLAASPDGSRLASGAGDGTMRIWDVVSGNELALFHAESQAVNSVAWSPDGSQLAAAERGRVSLWDIAMGKEVRALGGDAEGLGAIRCVVWSPDGRRLAAAGAQLIQVWDAATGAALLQLKGHDGPVNCVAWNPDGVRLASSGQDGTARVWDTVAGKGLPGPLHHGANVRTVAWSPDGNLLASGGDDNLVRIWDTTTGAAISVFRAHATVVQALAWQPGTRRLATVSNHDLILRQWDLSRTNQPLPALRGHASPILALAWGADGAWLASGDEAGEIKIWNPDAEDAQIKSEAIHGSFESVEWSPDGLRLAVAAANGFATILDASTEGIWRTFSAPKQSVSCVTWSRDGKHLAAAFDGDAPGPADAEHPAEVAAPRSSTPPVVIWDADTGGQLLALNGHAGAVRKVAWSPDSKRLVSAGRDGTAKIWNAETGEEVLTLRGLGGQMLTADWCPDGRRVATGSMRQPGIQIWDAATGEALRVLEPGSVFCVAWSPDGQRLATAHEDGRVIIWDAAGGKQLLVFRGHTAGVLEVAWNPDGIRMLSVGREGLVKIWDPNDGRELLTFGKFARAAWSRDGARLVCVGNNAPASLVLYDATLGYAVSRSARALAGLNRWLETHPDDLGYLRRRAEVFAALGEWDQSAADNRRKLARTRDEVPRWFETGWWVCGPRAGAMNPALPPGNQLEPVPATAANDSRASNPMVWQPLSAEAEGNLNLSDFIHGTAAESEPVAYAQKRLWSAQSLKLTLLNQSSSPVRLWLNGQLTEAVAPPANAVVTLPAGWNTLLAKVPLQGTNTFAVKLLPVPR